TARSVSVVVILGWLAVANPEHGAAYAWILGTAAFFLVSGLVQLWLYRRGAAIRLAAYAFILVDSLALAAVLLLPNPFAADSLPRALPLRFASFMYFFVLLMQTAFSFRPSLLVWTGLCGAGASSPRSACPIRDAVTRPTPLPARAGCWPRSTRGTPNGGQPDSRRCGWASGSTTAPWWQETSAAAAAWPSRQWATRPTSRAACSPSRPSWGHPPGHASAPGRRRARGCRACAPAGAHPPRPDIPPRPRHA